MKHYTGYKTMTGEGIRLGDKIKGLQSHVVVVLWSKKDKDFIVELDDREMQKRFPYQESLKVFLEAWSGNVTKEGNILER